MDWQMTSTLSTTLHSLLIPSSFFVSVHLTSLFKWLTLFDDDENRKNWLYEYWLESSLKVQLPPSLPLCVDISSSLFSFLFDFISSFLFSLSIRSSFQSSRVLELKISSSSLEASAVSFYSWPRRWIMTNPFQLNLFFESNSSRFELKGRKEKAQSLLLCKRHPLVNFNGYCHDCRHLR